MDEKLLQKLIDNIHEMLELHDKQRELYFKLIEALTVKAYKEKNPEENHVNLVSYRKKTGENWDRYLTYEALPTDDPQFKRLTPKDLWGNKIIQIGDTKYKDIYVKRYDLTKFFPDKIMIAIKS